MRVAAVSSVVSGRSFSSATRASSAATKSISSFIACRVISATSARSPRKSASSSSISFSMIVDSMSASSSRLRRPSARLNDEIDGQAGEGVRQCSAGRGVGQVGVELREEDVAGRARREPVDGTGPRAELVEGGANDRDGVVDAGARGRGDDQGQDAVGHRPVIDAYPAKRKGGRAKSSAKCRSPSS